MPIKVDGRRSLALCDALACSWAGDLLLVRADRVVLRRLGNGYTATTAQVAAELRRLADPAARAGAHAEPDVPALIGSLRQQRDSQMAARAHATLARVLATVPPFDRTGLPAASDRLVTFLDAWWALFRDSLVWHADSGRYEYVRPPRAEPRAPEGGR